MIDWSDCPHLSTFLYKQELYFDIPSELKRIRPGDWRNAVWLCYNGKVHYMDDVMTVHEQFTKGSYTEKNFANGIYYNYEARMKQRQENFDIMDRVTEYRYHDAFQNSINRMWGDYFWDAGKYKEALKMDGYYKNKPLRKKIIMPLVALVPGFDRLYRVIIRKKDAV